MSSQDTYKRKEVFASNASQDTPSLTTQNAVLNNETNSSFFLRLLLLSFLILLLLIHLVNSGIDP